MPATPKPTIIFDHVHNVVVQTGTGPQSDKKLAELLDAQRAATVSGTPKPE